MSHAFDGHCPVCGKAARFQSPDAWYRDHLNCSVCGSIPRERAFAHLLERHRPDWRDVVLHESSPAERLVSQRLTRECRGYIASQYWPDLKPGELRDGVRNENLEAMTFDDESIDIHCHLDVMEHVNRPENCLAEMERTLRPGGTMLFTTPVYEGRVTTERRAWYDDEGNAHFIGEPEYHGNPIDETGAPVTFHYGSDLADMILMWTQNCGLEVVSLNDPRIGVLGKFREVFVVTKHG